MRIWRARLLALLTAVAMLLAVSGPAAMADDDWDDWGDDDYGGTAITAVRLLLPYYYGDDDGTTASSVRGSVTKQRAGPQQSWPFLLSLFIQTETSVKSLQRTFFGTSRRRL